jgi:uncharacterized SAM-binding protein YcdF (DUF218 family)
MFLFFSKLLPPLVFPPGGNLVLLMLAWFTRKRWPRLAGAMFAASVLTLYVLSTTWGSGLLLRPLESRYADVEVPRVPQSEMIVILGGGVDPAAGLHKDAELSGAGDRVREAVALYRAGKAPVIFISGGNVEFLDGGAEPEAIGTARMLESLGVPAAAIVAEDASRNTHENAELTGRTLAGRGVHRILLVTSASHMPRAAALFRHAGLEVIPAPCNYMTGWGKPSLLFSLVPQPEHLTDSKSALREYAGLLVYWMRGWL